MKPNDHPHRVVCIATFHGGQICHRRQTGRHQSQTPHAPRHPWVKSLDHNDPHNRQTQKKPLQAVDTLLQKQQCKQDCEYRAEVLNDRRTRERNVSNGVKKSSQRNHSHQSTDKQPPTVVPQQGNPGTKEINSTQYKRNSRSQEHELESPQMRKLFDTQVGRGVQHHRSEHGKESCPQRTTVTVPRSTVGTISWYP